VSQALADDGNTSLQRMVEPPSLDRMAAEGTLFTSLGAEKNVAILQAQFG